METLELILKKANNEPFFIQPIFKKTELKVLIDHQIISFLKKCLGVGLVLTIFRARHVLGPEMSQGHSLLTCLRARQFSQGLRLEISRAQSVSWPDLGRSRKCLGDKGHRYVGVVFTHPTYI